MPQEQPLRIALVWHGDRAARDTVSREEHRFSAVAQALRACGVETIPVVYNDAFADEVGDQLANVDGALVWVNPIEQGNDRTRLDELLRAIATSGKFVSAHPDTILKMGTKEVLYRTRHMSWGGDTYLYSTMQELSEQLPVRLAEGKPRVLKQYRGNGGNGVWKVQNHLTNAALVRVHHALRGSIVEDIPFTEFLARCESYFTGSGRLIDQAYQERLPEGMVRCYLVGNEVAGFGHQKINALFPAPAGGAPTDAPPPGPRLYYPPTTLEFQPIKAKMETEWLHALCRTLDLEPAALPLLWDADLLLGPKTLTGEDTYVLCEINVSCVTPFPDDTLIPLARATKERLLARCL